jgi:hypothetical protein
MPSPRIEPIGQIFDFCMTLQDIQTGNIETTIASVAAYDFEQAMENLQRRFPQLEPIIDKLRIQQAGLNAQSQFDHGRL